MKQNFDTIVTNELYNRMIHHLEYGILGVLSTFKYYNGKQLYNYSAKLPRKRKKLLRRAIKKHLKENLLD